MRPPLPEFPADASPTAQLMRRLFVDLGEPTGGPMHLVLEDGNVEDGDLDYCASDANMAYLSDGQFERYAQAGADVSDRHKQAIRDVCAEITALMRPMTEAQRRKAVNEFWAWWAPNAAAVMVEQAGGYEEEEEDDEPDAGEDDVEPGPKACVSIPCPPFEEVTLGVPLLAHLASATPRFPIPPEMLDPKIPRIVVVPDHITMEQAEWALLVCRDLGLIQDTPNGVLFLPSGLPGLGGLS